jgi:hypothetical protein
MEVLLGIYVLYLVLVCGWLISMDLVRTHGSLVLLVLS